MKILMMSVLAATAFADSSQAAVAERTDQGFRTKSVIEVSAPPAKAYAALGQIGSWWSDAHTYTGKAANMSIRLQPGACFCEVLPQGGGVRHGVVVLAWPERHTLRLDAALGPLQDEAAVGALTFQIAPKGAGSTITVTYHVGGLRPASAKAFADGVDQVIGAQAGRLGRFVDTGKPD